MKILLVNRVLWGSFSFQEKNGCPLTTYYPAFMPPFPVKRDLESAPKKKERELQAHASSEGPASPIIKAQDKKPRPYGRAPVSAALMIENCWFSEEAILR
jgi:hypothetical protein